MPGVLPTNGLDEEKIGLLGLGDLDNRQGLGDLDNRQGFGDLENHQNQAGFGDSDNHQNQARTGSGGTQCNPSMNQSSQGGTDYHHARPNTRGT